MTLLATAPTLPGGSPVADELHRAVASSLAAIEAGATAARTLVGCDHDAALAAVAALGQLAAGALDDVRRLVDLLPNATARRALADDVHDTLGHALSLSALLAGGARARLTSDPQLARDALGQIAAVAAASADELDELLGSRPRPRPPADATALARLAAGQPVTLDVDRAALAQAPPEVAAAVYRIVQESLTNARRHARGAAVRVRVAVEDDGLAVAVVNASAPPCERPGDGHGIPSMLRRARTVGGRLAAGPTRGGGFRVEATLPLS
jgi:signal transduction histidine kinase